MILIDIRNILFPETVLFQRYSLTVHSAFRATLVGSIVVPMQWQAEKDKVRIFTI